MLYKFTNTKPSFTKLWEDIQTTFTKPLYGTTLLTTQFRVLQYLSTTDFAISKQIMKPGVTEDEFNLLPKTTVKELSALEQQYIHHIPNPDSLPPEVLLKLMRIENEALYCLITDNDVLPKILEAEFEDNNQKISAVLGTPDTVLNFLQIHFIYNDELSPIEVNSKSDLEDYIFNAFVVGNTTLPKFVYKRNEAEYPISDADFGTSDTDFDTDDEDWEPRSICVKGSKDDLGLLYRTSNIENIANYQFISQTDYNEVRNMKMHCEGHNPTGRIRAFCYNTTGNDLRFVDIHNPDFTVSTGNIILRYKEL